MKSFGVGCFHFSIAENAANSFSVRDYIQELQRALSSIDTVSDIEITFDESISDRLFTADAPYPQMSEGEGFFPIVNFLELHFRLYIPKRIQAELIEEEEVFVSTGTEYFRLHMQQAWHGPLTYIECLDAQLNSTPSDAVRIVREYLEKAFSRVSTWIRFDYLGPSPFHCDFFLSQSDNTFEDTTVFKCEHVKKPGYDRMQFSYSSDFWINDEEAFAELMEQLKDELAFFYSLNSIEASRLGNWRNIDNILNQILSFESKDAKQTLKERLFVRPKLLREIFRDLGLFKGAEIFSRAEKNRSYSSIYSSGKRPVYLKHAVDQEIKDMQDFPIAETEELMKYFDQKNSKGFELTVTFFAALMGAVIGALITVAFGK